MEILYKVIYCMHKTMSLYKFGYNINVQEDRAKNERWQKMSDEVKLVNLTNDGYIKLDNGGLVGVWYERGGEIQVEVMRAPEADALEMRDCVKLFEAEEDDADDVFEFLTKLGVGDEIAEVIAEKLCKNIFRAHGYYW